MFSVIADDNRCLTKIGKLLAAKGQTVVSNLQHRPITWQDRSISKQIH